MSASVRAPTLQFDDCLLQLIALLELLVGAAENDVLELVEVGENAVAERAHVLTQPLVDHRGVAVVDLRAKAEMMTIERGRESAVAPGAHNTQYEMRPPPRRQPVWL